MKTGSKLSLLSLGLALSCGVFSTSFFSSNKKAINTKADGGTQYWVLARNTYDFVSDGEGTPILLGTFNGDTAKIVSYIPVGSSSSSVAVEEVPLRSAGSLMYLDYQGYYSTLSAVSPYSVPGAAPDGDGFLIGQQGSMNYLEVGNTSINAIIEGTIVNGATAPMMKSYSNNGSFLNTVEDRMVVSTSGKRLAIDDYNKLTYVYNYYENNSIGIFYQTTVFSLKLNLPTGDVQSVPVFNGAPLESINYPQMDGYVFEGFFDCQKGGKMYFDKYGMPVETSLSLTSDLNLYAHYYREIDKEALVHDNDDFKSLQEDIISFSSAGTSGSNEAGHCNVGNSTDLVLNNPDNFIYTFTGSNEGRNGGYRIAKPADNEYTYYIRLKDWIYYNNSWGGGPGFGNDYITSEGTFAASTKPIHYVFIIEGTNIVAGHNQTGISFEINNMTDPLKTIQFTTEIGGSFAAAMGCPNCANAIAFRINEPDEQLIPFNSFTKLTSVQVGKGSNFNSFSTSMLKNKVNQITPVNFDPTYDGLVSAIRANYPTQAGGYDASVFRYDVFKFTLEPNHQYIKHDAVHAGCTETGLKEYYTCECPNKYWELRDGEYVEVSYDSLITPETGHNYVATVTKMATTEEEGVITYTCSGCGDSYTESIAKLPAPPKQEDLTPEEYEQQQKEYEEKQQEAVDTMVKVLPDVVVVPEEPTQDQYETEEEYQEQLAKYEEKQENAQKLNQALETISNVNTTDTSSEEAIVSKETKQQAQENVVQITSTITSEMNSLDDAKADLQTELDSLLQNFDEATATEEEKQAVEAKKEEIKQVEIKKEIVEVVTTQAVVVTAKQTEIESITKEANLDDVPEDAGLGDMGQVFNDFMQKQIDELLGKGKEPVPQKSRALKRAEEPQTQGIDYGLSKEVYKQVEQFVDQTVSNASEMANKVRNCTGVESKAEIKLYVEKITSESFRDFDKAAADAEFAENAYRAVLRNMQSQVLAALEENKPSGNYEQLQSWQEEYDAVSDIEEFEIMVVEVMRVKYNSISTEVKYDDVDTFMPIYKEIFTNWALNKEDTSGITLEQLTTATVEETSRRVGPVIIYKELESSETAALVIFIAVAAAVIAAAAIVPTVLKKKRGGVR